MSPPVLVTKLFIPPPRPKVVPRPRLMERLNDGVHRKLTLISAPAGFGKTTLVSEWIHQKDEGGRRKDESEETHRPSPLIPHSSPLTVHPSSFTLHPSRVAWLSLDEGDNDPARFLIHLVAAMRMIGATIGDGVVVALQSPQPPSIESILTTLLNDITTLPDPFVLVLDDYHVIDAQPVDKALTFLLDYLPPQMRLVIASREDPSLPLARYRARGQLAEVRAADLRFTPAEAAEFLNTVMGLTLAADDIAALETRTEGWIAGLQLAAISMQGHHDTSGFIQSFTGSHHFVMDYLVEEVLQQQPEHVQTFLLQTSILNRLCGPLCDAVLGKDEGEKKDEGGRMKDEPEINSGSSSFILPPSSFILEYLERANLFIVPLDNERRWYRYHHLFADLLRQRLRQSFTASDGNADSRIHELHIRASQWYEDNDLDIEAFHHATVAQDIGRAERLIEGRGIPLHFRGAVITILDWLASLPKAVLDARPWLWARYASLMLVNGQTTGVEEKIQAAEAAIHGAPEDARIRNFRGGLATARAVLALTRYDVDAMLTQSRRALEYLNPNNLWPRANAHWVMGYAYLLEGDRVAARRAFTEAISVSQATGDNFTIILPTIGLGMVQEMDNELHQAAQTYRHILRLAGDQPLQIIYEAHLGLARVLYEWNDLEAAEQHGRQSLHLARQYDRVIDRFIVCEVFLARLRLAHGDVSGAAAILAQANQSARQQNFVFRIPEVAAAQVVTYLRQGQLAAAAHLAQTYPHPLSQARVHLAQGDPAAALAVLDPWRQQVEARGWADDRLKVMLLQAVALQAQGDQPQALRVLGEALALAEPSGYIRLFIDEGAPMAHLLSEAATLKVAPHYVDKLLAAFETPMKDETEVIVQRPASSVHGPASSVHHPSSLIEPLSQRELEILRLVALGLSNHEISARLFLALDTVKGHNRKIFDKLHVQRRTEAVARARELGLL